MQFTYHYCCPEPDPLDEWAQKARSLRAVLPDYIKKVKNLSRALKRLETPDRMQLLGNHLSPEAPTLERYAQELEAAVRPLKEAGTRGQYAPILLIEHVSIFPSGLPGTMARTVDEQSDPRRHQGPRERWVQSARN